MLKYIENFVVDQIDMGFVILLPKVVKFDVKGHLCVCRRCICITT